MCIVFLVGWIVFILYHLAVVVFAVEDVGLIALSNQIGFECGLFLQIHTEQILHK